MKNINEIICIFQKRYYYMRGDGFPQRSVFLAYETRFSTIFTSADKSDLTYLYPTHWIDNKGITTCVVNTLVV